MAITCTPTITKVINEARREIVMSVEIDDGNDPADIRTITNIGKAKTAAEGKQLMDAIITEYQRQLTYESMVETVKEEMEANAKTYLETQLNG